MRFHAEPIDFERQPGVGAPLWHGRAADGEDLLRFAISVHRHDGRLCALWGSDERSNGHGFRVHAIFALDEGWQYLTLDLPADDPVYPDLSGVFAAANRMQRATFDLVGIRHDGEDQRPWLRHGGWPADWFPLRHDAGDAPAHDNLPTDYEFVKVGGEGAHEIPVGPIHAGIIEPGHFRFTVVGERVLRLEQRLGYLHKGTERRLAGADFSTGAKLVGRVSGDSTCAFAWAFAGAVEAACGVEPSPRALHLRALLLERERVANHLGDLGMLGNDAAFGFGLSQFFRLKEDWVRLNAQVFGHRFLMDRIVPGGVAVDVDAAGLAAAGSARRSKPRSRNCSASTTSTPACRTASSLSVRSTRRWCGSCRSPAWRRAPPACCSTRAATATAMLPPRRGARWRCARPPTNAATSPRAWRCASPRSMNRCA